MSFDHITRFCHCEEGRASHGRTKQSRVHYETLRLIDEYEIATP